MTASRTITNRYQDFHLLDLSRLMKTSAGRGPFLLVQDGCDPADPQMRECAFVLTKRGTWLHFYLYLALSEKVREQCAYFETVAEVLQRADTLPANVVVEDAASLQELLHEAGFEPDASDPLGQALLREVRLRHRLAPPASSQ